MLPRPSWDSGLTALPLLLLAGTFASIYDLPLELLVCLHHEVPQICSPFPALYALHACANRHWLYFFFTIVCYLATFLFFQSTSPYPGHLKATPETSVELFHVLKRHDVPLVVFGTSKGQRN